jgi:hypothetical protein
MIGRYSSEIVDMKMARILVSVLLSLLAQIARADDKGFVQIGSFSGDKDAVMQIGTFNATWRWDVDPPGWQYKDVTFDQEYAAPPRIWLSNPNARADPGNIRTTGFSPFFGTGDWSPNNKPNPFTVTVDWMAVGQKLNRYEGTASYIVLTVIYAPPGVMEERHPALSVVDPDLLVERRLRRVSPSKTQLASPSLPGVVVFLMVVRPV